jgi:sodium/potassium-transporting ATPase subunit alpha
MNYLLLPAIIFSLVIALIFIYPESLHEALGTAVVPVEHWFLPMGFGMGILLLDETRKYVVRNYPRSFLAKIAW